MKKVALSLKRSQVQKPLTCFFSKKPQSQDAQLKSQPSCENTTAKEKPKVESPKKRSPLKQNKVNSPLKKETNNQQYKIETFLTPSPAKAKRKRVESPKKSPLKPKQLKLSSPQKADLLNGFFNVDFHIKESPIKTESALNLEKLERYEVLNVESLPTGDLKLDIKNLIYSDNTGMCVIKSPWSDCPVKSGDIVSVKGVRSGEGWVVDWNGLLVINSDHLISGTTIVGSLFCTRKTVLSNFFDEIGERDSRLMIIGCIVHELLQEVLTKKYQTYEEIQKVYNEIIKKNDFTVKLFLEKMDYENTLTSISSYLPKIFEFVNRYVTFGKRNALTVADENWQGEIINVKDIEETIWSPTLGIKGKVDATVQVRNGKKTKIMPLELKTGKVSFSLEHRGQVILYCMLLQELGEFVDSGLLLYLKDEGGLKEIKAAEKEIRDLTLLRNGLSNWLLQAEKYDETCNSLPPPSLPPPINRKFCQSCGHLIACSSALRINGVDELADNNILKKLVPQVTSHLSDEHLKYIYNLVGLQSLENNSSKSSVSRIWNNPPDKREENGWCLMNMEVDSSSVAKGGRFEIHFKKSNSTPLKEIFEPGQTVVVSKDSQVAIAMGFVQSINPLTISIFLDRFIKPTEKGFQIDSYESSSFNNVIRANLGLLLDNTPKAQSLRETIIDLKLPTFLPKLSSKVKKIGQDIFDRLNKEQIRAVLQAFSAEQYILIKGMPGTGKTTTMRALIELLVKFGNRVLVTSYTHSAIDNILMGMVNKVSMLRIGSDRRIHPSLKPFSEQSLLNKLNSPTVEKLEKLYKSKQVVGVTCHGSGHLWLQRQEFDVCLVDEATQVTQPVILRPLFLAKKFILIGDPKQLPPLVINENAKELGLGESLFKRLDRPAVTSVLSQQYRMNQRITDLANGFSYDGLLKCGSEQVANAVLHFNHPLGTNLPSWKSKSLSPDLEDSVVVINVEDTISANITNINESECKVVVELVKDFEKLGVKGSSIGVIATYREQVNLLKTLLSSIKDIEVNTVDQYQGRDKEIIIYSITRSKKSSGNDITGDTNRLTVAITRAKKKLIIVCDVELMKSYDNFNKLFKSINESNFVKYQST